MKPGLSKAVAIFLTENCTSRTLVGMELRTISATEAVLSREFLHGGIARGRFLYIGNSVWRYELGGV